METLNVPQGSFALARVPRAGKRPLRAWDAADEYVLDHLAEVAHSTEAGTPNVLVIGDSFGALTCGLWAWNPTVVCESAAGRQAIAENLERTLAAGVGSPDQTAVSERDVTKAGVLSVLDLADGAGDEPFDVVVIKIPKATPHLVEILHIVRPLVTASTHVIGAAMSKHIHTSTIDAFEKILGPTSTSLAKKKARLVHVTPDADRQPRPNPWPKTWKAHGHTLTNHGGGFSPNKLDPGTSLLLDSVRSIEEFLPDPVTATGDPFHVVDLGCGNGVIGLAMSTLLSQFGVSHQVSAVDDSALAIRAAGVSWDSSPDPAGADRTIELHHAHRLVNVLDDASADLVVVNPPFHEDRVLGDETAWSMFVDAHKVLRPGGHLIVVGNRHLAYHAKLKKIFGGVDNLGSNAKFVVLASKR